MRPSLATFAGAAADLAIAVAVLVLAGWTLDLDPLKRVLPGLVSMNPMTAVAFALAGISLRLRHRPDASDDHRRLARLTAAAVVVIGLLKLAELAHLAEFVVDQWLFTAQLEGDHAKFPNRMAGSTALGFLMLGLALLMLDLTGRQGRRPAEWLALGVLLIALLALAGFAYHRNDYVGAADFMPMALHSAAVFAALALAVLAARPRVGMMAVVAGPGPGGLMARLLLPGMAVVMLLIGWLRLEGERHGLYDTATGVALFTLTSIVLLGALIWRGALSLDRADRERERLHAQQRQSEARTRSIIDTASDAFVAIDAAGIVIDWNRQAEATFGWLRQEAIGARLSSMILPAQHLLAHEQGLKGFASGGDSAVLNRRIEITALRRDGVEFPIELSIWPVRNDGSCTFNAFIRDITERKRSQDSILALNEELRANAAQLQNTNRELEAFSYTISHDLRAPLRHIGGYARMLDEDAGDQLDAEMRRYLDAIGSSARQMGMLIDDLLAFSRLGRKPVERVGIEMRSLVARALAEVASDGDPRVTVGALPAAQADPVLLRQVWVNLLSNALKYSAPRGAAARVDITGEDLGDRVRYRIRDNGVGFDMAYVDKLFGVFQRLHSQDEFEGTGVGLAIVQRIVLRHGGRIEADAEPGRGATFSFELPVGARDRGDEIDRPDIAPPYKEAAT